MVKGGDPGLGLVLFICLGIPLLLIAAIAVPSALDPSMRTIDIKITNVGDVALPYELYFDENLMWSDTIGPGDTVHHQWIKPYGFWNGLPDTVFLRLPNTIFDRECSWDPIHFMVD